MKRANINVTLLKEQIELIESGLPYSLLTDEEARIDGLLDFLHDIATGEIVCYKKELNGNLE
jgi:hypothetical protein